MVRMLSITCCIVYLILMILFPFELKAAEADSLVCAADGPGSAPCDNPITDVLIIYVTFPDQTQYHDLPGYRYSVETRMEQYYDEMSSGNTTVNMTTMIRPAPFFEDRYIADNDYSYYNDGTWAKWYELIDEVLQKVYDDDDTAFQGIDFVALFYSPNMLDALGVSGAYDATFGSNTSIYNGPGTSSNGTAQWVVEWHIAHEYGHCLGFWHDRENGPYSVMSGRGYTGNATAYNPQSRLSLGWIDGSQLVTVTSDLSNQTVSDVWEGGKIYKILNSTGSEYYFVENRQNTRWWDSKLKGTGILIWRKRSTDNSTLSYVMQANGSWQWQTETCEGSTVKVYNNATGYFRRDFSDRVNGEGTLELWNEDVCINGQKKSGYFDRELFGDQNHFWTNTYNNIFTPWSNMRSTLDNDVGVYIKSESNGVFTLDIFTSESSSQNAPPAKPYDLTITSVGNHPYLEWDSNVEPDLDRYNIYRDGVYLDYVTAPSNNYTDTQIDTRAGPKTFYYKIKAKDTQGLLSLFSNVVSITGMFSGIKATTDYLPLKYRLEQNFPNPFNPVTEIKFDLQSDGYTRLIIYDLSGKEVTKLIDQNMEAGFHYVTWNASEAASGIYFYRIKSGNYSKTKKMVLLR